MEQEPSVCGVKISVLIALKYSVTHSALCSLSELPGQGHWFDGILSDDEAQRFLDRYLDRQVNPTLSKPPFPDAFTITTMNPFSTGSKGGIRILQAQVPFRLATIRVRRKNDGWVMDTTNVRRLGFVYDERQEEITSFSLDGKLFGIPPSRAGPSYLRNSMADTWEAAPDLLWISKERHPSTYGPVIHVGLHEGSRANYSLKIQSQVLNHPFLIIVPSHTHSNISHYNHLAQQIAMSWYACCRGNTQIVKDVELLDGLAAQFNVIVLGGPIDNLYTRRRENEGVSTMSKSKLWIQFFRSTQITQSYH